MEKLTVRNFGQIIDVELELKQLTVIIGDNGTDRNILTKLISIFRNRDFLESSQNDTDCFIRHLVENQIECYLSKNTYIEYETKFGNIFKFENSKMVYVESDKFINQTSSIVQNYDISKIKDIGRIVNQIIESTIAYSVYIPFNREVINLFDMLPSYVSELFNILPKYLRNTYDKFKQICANSDEYFIELLNLKYKRINGKEYIEFCNERIIPLCDASNEVKSTIIMILIIEGLCDCKTRKSFIIEEPENGLHPSKQKLLIDFFAKKILSIGHDLILTTNSPYILISLNNLIFADDVGKYHNEVENIIPKNTWIDKNIVSAYLLKDGKIISIIDDESSQINAEILDSVSNIINSTYDKLLDISIN